MSKYNKVYINTSIMIRLFENSVANTRNVCSLNFLDNEAMVNVINKIDDQDNRILTTFDYTSNN